MTDKEIDKPQEPPKYISIRKETRALKIKTVVFGPDGDATLTPEDMNCNPVHVDTEFVKAYHISNGGYFVSHEEGPPYWLPAEAFEGHHEAEDHTERNLQRKQEKLRHVAEEQNMRETGEPTRRIVTSENVRRAEETKHPHSKLDNTRRIKEAKKGGTENEDALQPHKLQRAVIDERDQSRAKAKPEHERVRLDEDKDKKHAC